MASLVATYLEMAVHLATAENSLKENLSVLSFPTWQLGSGLGLNCLCS